MTLPSPFFSTDQVSKCPQQKSPVNEQPKEVPKRNYAAFCKYCQEGFTNDTELFQHRKTHIKCPYDECKFSANEVTVSSHIQRAHLKQNALVKIQDLTTPEQIEKWREERRKRYPTTQNVILRQQLQEERLNRGEKLHESKRRFGDHQQKDFVKNMGNKRNDNNRGNKSNRHNNQHRNKKFDRPQKESPEKHKLDTLQDKTKEFKVPVAPIETKKSKVLDSKEVESSDDEEPRKIPRFKGTSTMKDYQTVETIVKENSALSVLGMYGSDSDSDEAVPECAEIKELDNIKPEESNQVEALENKNEEVDESENDSDNDEGPEEIPIVKEGENDVQQVDEPNRCRKRKRNEQKDKVHKKMTRRSGLDYSKLRNKSINPFLEKLLERDIVHERNVLLQCVNFVVKNNFFGIGQKE